MEELMKSLEKYSAYQTETITDTIVILLASLISLAIKILIAYIAYRLIKRLIRYGIDYYFKMKEYHDGRNAIDEIQQDIIRKHPKEDEP